MTRDLPGPRIEHQARRLAGAVVHEGKTGMVATVHQELVARQGDDRGGRAPLEIEDRQSSACLDLELAVLDGDLKIGRGAGARTAARTIASSIGASCPLRAILNRTSVLAGPRILSSAWLRVIPRVATPSTCVMMSLAMTPALAAGAPRTGETTLSRPSCRSMLMPSPPNGSCLSRELDAGNL